MRRGRVLLAPFVQRALIADAGLAWSLSRRLGHQRAAELLLHGERLRAETAHDAGLVSRLVALREARVRALELAQQLALGPADAIRLNKALLRRPPSLSLDAFLDDEYLHVALNGHSRDVAEGREAFVNKRQPRWR